MKLHIMLFLNSFNDIACFANYTLHDYFVFFNTTDLFYFQVY